MKYKYLVLILVLGFFFIASGIPSYKHKLAQDQGPNTVPSEHPVPNADVILYHEGMITIKMKEGYAPLIPQRGNVQFDLTAMDMLAEKFEISSLEKRFRHRPIPQRSGLPDLSRIYKISFPVEHSVPEVVAHFSRLKELEYAEAIPVSYVCEIPNDTLYDMQQHLPQIMAAEAWDIHHGEDGAEDIVIGINDTGVDWKHPDLVDNIWQNLGEDADGDGHVLEFNGVEWVFDPGDENGIDDDLNGFPDDFIGWDYYMNDNNPDPNPGSQSFDHGTHCAGIAAGRTGNTTGIASVSWNVKIFSTQVDEGTWLTWGYDAMIYAAEMGIDIISNSWGDFLYSRAFEEVVAYADGLGCIIVAAAGNQDYDFIPIYPGGYPGVISVAALNSDDSRTSYSNSGKWVDVSAPGGGTGGGILSTITNNRYSSFSGTSMATPMAAGLLGLVKSYNPGWTNDEIIVQVLGTADDIDALNPGYENMLGSGRINAFRALDETNVPGPQELKIDFIGTNLEEDNGNGLLEPGETVDIDITLWNRCPASMSYNTTFTISTDDPGISLITSTRIDTVPYDSYFTLEGFQVQIDPDATPHVASFTLDIDSDISVTYGQELKFYLPIMADGILVYEGKAQGDSYSGTYISNFLDNQGIDNVYSAGFPETFTGYDQVLLSYGNWGCDSGNTITDQSMINVITDYTIAGGNVYMEATDLFGFTAYNNTLLKGLFGISQAGDGTASNVPITYLEGMAGALTDSMLFTGSNQVANIWIDKYATTENGIPAFVQDDDTVAVQNSGDSLQKTFCYSYCLAEMVDNSSSSSRINLLYKILDFLEYDFGEEWVIANFSADTLYGGVPLTVNFLDWSLYDSLSSSTTWEWDLDGDGTVDSYDRNPLWTYEDAGQYPVTLTIYTSDDTSTITKEGFIWVNEGVFVYEGVEDGPDYSGAFIRDYLLNAGLTVEYRNVFPPGFNGFDAVFLSYGNKGSGKTEFSTEMWSKVFPYLVHGGNVYLEGGDCASEALSFPDFKYFFSIFVTAQGSENMIDSLTGYPDALTHDITFTGSDQTSFESIDMMLPDQPDGKAAFNEKGYFDVAVQAESEYASKTFLFSYALAALQDGDFPSTRENLLERISIFFDILVGEREDQIIADPFSMTLFPNPCSGQVQIQLNIPHLTNTSIDLYSISGTLVKNIANGRIMSGEHIKMADVNNLPSGIYLIVARTKEVVITKKMVKY